MAKCPDCKKEVATPKKAWKYGKFFVEVFYCPCGTCFREYSINKKHKFTLKLKRGKGFVKA